LLLLVRESSRWDERRGGCSGNLPGVTSIWVGERVRLRQVEPEDWSAYKEFDEYTDDQRTSWRVMPPRSAEGYRRWATDRATAPHHDDNLELAVESLEDKAPVGMVSVREADPRNGTFALGVAIGRPHQRRGYATEAVLLVLRYLFGECRYQKCDVAVYADNRASLALFQRLGFSLEGRRRRQHFHGGRYHDVDLLGLTVEEFAQWWIAPDGELRADNMSGTPGVPGDETPW
jgi:RimJ/RimL family protein N-acetyltransferase